MATHTAPPRRQCAWPGCPAQLLQGSDGFFRDEQGSVVGPLHPHSPDVPDLVDLFSVSIASCEVCEGRTQVVERPVARLAGPGLLVDCPGCAGSGLVMSRQLRALVAAQP